MDDMDELREVAIIVEVPRYISNGDVEEYIKHAVEGWGGGLHPKDVFFGGIPVREMETRRFKKET